MFQRVKNTKTHQPPSGPPPLPPAPATRQLQQLSPGTVSDVKALEGRAIQLKTIGIANTLQPGPQTSPFAPREITLLIERVEIGPRGGIEGKILLDPRDHDRRLKDGLNHAGMNWLYEGEEVFLPLMELRTGYSIIDCQVATAPEAKQWIARSLKIIERHNKGLPPNGANLVDSLPSAAKLGIAGASLAGALIGFKFISYKDNQQEAHKAATSNYFARVKSPLSHATIDPKLRSFAAASATAEATDQLVSATQSSSAATEAPLDTPPPATPPPTLGDPVKIASHLSETATLATVETRLYPTKSATSFNYTPQNSVDISTIYLTQGQLTFRGDNQPVAINFQPTFPTNSVVIGPLLKISEGDLIQALAIGLDSMRKANQGTFPAGSTFRLVVSIPISYGTTVGTSAEVMVERQFPIDPRRVPTERELSYDAITNASSSLREAYEYIEKVLCLNVSRESHAAPGGYRLESSFALRSSYKTPARVTILRDMP